MANFSLVFLCFNDITLIFSTTKREASTTYNEFTKLEFDLSMHLVHTITPEIQQRDISINQFHAISKYA